MARTVSWRVLLSSLVVLVGLSLPLRAYAGESTVPAKGKAPTAHSQRAKRLNNWRHHRNKIEFEFRQAVERATFRFHHASKVAHSSAQRYAALNEFDAAIAQAALNRSHALSALGTEPGPPGKPGKPGKPDKGSGDRASANNRTSPDGTTTSHPSGGEGNPSANH